ncbi:SEC7-like guanine nucleotide exchange family protein [Rhynchospora pubera]|uniref:SEC7-like guanine nucleotide exchange family protein n=1 Tax=Rhynchospora pubera TaxID=906938 RepID=A0AAV8D1L0_9POAL|nr:SEC7-like guanine nucleotide exchange family protein [Rhynchospora pubera]
MGGPIRSSAAACPLRTSMACVVSAEVSTVLAVMRRNVRWGGPIGVRYGTDGHGDDHSDHPLIQSLKLVRSLAFTWDPQGFLSVDPTVYLRPFLDIIRSDETGAPITGAALNSLYKLFALDVFDVSTANITGALDAVVDAVTGCRFEVTDPASEEAVLVKILQVLLGCVRSRAAPSLTNRHVCAIVNTCFRVVQQAGTKGELLQRVSRQTMQEVVRCVFSRLADLSPEEVKPNTNQIAETKMVQNESGDSTEMNLEPDPALNDPFGIPCMVEIFEFLCSLINIAEDIEINARVNPIDFDEDVPLFALGLVQTAIELSGLSIHKHRQLLSFVKDELFRNLMQFGLSLSPLILSTVCSIVLNLFYHLRGELKLQLEAFFSGVILRLAQSRHGATYQQQEVAMEALVDFCRQKEFMAEMYTNMDCEIMCSNVFEDLISLLSKSAFPVNAPLSSLNVLALEGLVAVVQSFSERVGSRPHMSDLAVSEELDKYHPFWLVKYEDITNPGKWVQFMRHRKVIKKKLAGGVDQFNKNPKKGLEFLQNAKLLPENLDPESVALLLRYTPGLDKNLLGDYLGHHDDFCILVLHEFSRTFDFTGMSLDTALRLFLETFRLPGESQKIQRVLEAFSERYYEQSPQILVNKDAALVLSYSLIMLNTDQHNIRVKNKMTEEDFIRNNRRINGGSDLPREYLSEMYFSICRNEIRTMPADSGAGSGVGIPEMTLSRWLDLMAKANKASPYIKCDCSQAVLDHDMFAIIAGPAVAAISVVFDYTEHNRVLSSCIDGFMSVAKLAASYHTEEALNDLVVALCKFTNLQNISNIDDPVTAFGEDTKARMATEAVFYIANQYGDHIRSGWKSIVNCTLSLHKLGLLPARLTSDMSTDESSEPSSSESLITKPLVAPTAATQTVANSNPRRSYSLMGRFTQLLSLDTEEVQTQPTEEQLAARQSASDTVSKCQIDNIFAESKFLHADSLSHLARALVQAADQPKKISASSDEEDTAVFCLELLITITLNNRDRIILLWQGIYEHIARVVQSTVMPCNLVEKAVFGLLHICQRLLPYKENLSDDLLRSLQLILKLDARVADAYCENITQEVARLLKANASHIRSQTGWRTVINLLSITARHPDACETGFDALVFVMSDGAHLSPANFILCIEAARQFADSRLVPGDRSVQALELMAGSVSCLSRCCNEVKEVGGEAEQVLDGIREMWLRLVLALRRVCTDNREEVRNQALISMQRCLVGVDGICLSGPVWLQSFEVVFQLLDEMLEIARSHSPKDYRNMETSLLHGIKMMSKAFLQSLQDVSALGQAFVELWLGVLSRMEQYVKIKLRGRRMEKLHEAIPELLKNILLVMKVSGTLSRDNKGLWDATCKIVNNIAPSLLLEVFPEPDKKDKEMTVVPTVADGGIQAAV